MSKTAGVIELNGRRYNASTGAPMDQATRSLDGFLLSAPVKATLADEQGAPPEPTPEPRASRIGQHHAKHHPTQHSKTLMRQSVHHPKEGFKRHLKVAPHTATMVKSIDMAVSPKHSAHTIDLERLRRAGDTSRSDYVRRFAANPVILRRGEASYAPRQELAYNPPVPTAEIAPTAMAKQPSNDVFERALATANSHKQPYVEPKHRSKHGHKKLRAFVSVVASLAVVALIVGFVAYQNATLIQLRLASSKSGVNATMPIWQPSGFKLGTLTYGHNNVALTYTNPTTSQQYTVSESPTTWTSEALLNGYIYPNNETYDTINAGGTTIYTYGTNNATWVNNGIWYKLVSQGTLSTSQIVNIATSMRS